MVRSERIVLWHDLPVGRRGAHSAMVSGAILPSRLPNDAMYLPCSLRVPLHQLYVVELRVPMRLPLATTASTLVTGPLFL